MRMFVPACTVLLFLEPHWKFVQKVKGYYIGKPSLLDLTLMVVVKLDLHEQNSAIGLHGSCY
jgi:hypothetical protein